MLSYFDCLNVCLNIKCPTMFYGKLWHQSKFFWVIYYLGWCARNFYNFFRERSMLYVFRGIILDLFWQLGKYRNHLYDLAWLPRTIHDIIWNQRKLYDGSTGHKKKGARPCSWNFYCSSLPNTHTHTHTHTHMRTHTTTHKHTHTNKHNHTQAHTPTHTNTHTHTHTHTHAHTYTQTPIMRSFHKWRSRLGRVVKFFCVVSALS